jgi:hypothetical protein
VAIFLIVLAAWGAHEYALAQTMPSADPANDPRPGLTRFFDAIRSADKTAAMQCWHDDLRELEGDRRKYIGDLVSHLVDEMIAEYRLEQALASKMPDVRCEEGQAGRVGGPTPTADELAKAQFTIYRRLAVINWGRDEDSGFPMVYDNHGNERRWRISKRQWYATTHSSVGDALLLSGLSAKAKDATTPEILAGKFKTIEEVDQAYGRHMEEELVKVEKAKRGAQRRQPTGAGDSAVRSHPPPGA